MAKSLRSKIKRRYRSLKRGYVNQIKVRPQTEQLNVKCQKGLAGIEYRQKEKKNAFLHPNDPNSQFPQFKPAPIIDLRSSSIPGSGLQWSGAKKKQKVVQHLIPDSTENQMSQINQQIGHMQTRTKHKQQKRQNLMAQQKNIRKKNKRVSKLKKTFVF